MVVWICVCFVGYCVLVDYGGVGLGCRAHVWCCFAVRCLCLTGCCWGWFMILHVDLLFVGLRFDYYVCFGSLLVAWFGGVCVCVWMGLGCRDGAVLAFVWVYVWWFWFRCSV